MHMYGAAYEYPVTYYCSFLKANLAYAICLTHSLTYFTEYVEICTLTRLLYMEYVPRSGAFECPRIYCTSMYVCMYVCMYYTCIMQKLAPYNVVENRHTASPVTSHFG